MRPAALRYLGYERRCAASTLDWGDPGYLANLARKVEALHKTVGSKLVLIGVSYSGFGIATLASHHPEIHPDRLIVIDSFLDLVARRHALPPTHETATEIDAETGGSDAALQQRTVSIDGLAQLVRNRTQLTVFGASPQTSSEIRWRDIEIRPPTRVYSNRSQTPSGVLSSDGSPQSKHSRDLWDSGRAIIAGSIPAIHSPSNRTPRSHSAQATGPKHAPDRIRLVHAV